MGSCSSKPTTSATIQPAPALMSNQNHQSQPRLDSDEDGGGPAHRLQQPPATAVGGKEPQLHASLGASSSDAASRSTAASASVSLPESASAALPAAPPGPGGGAPHVAPPSQSPLAVLASSAASHTLSTLEKEGDDVDRSRSGSYVVCCTLIQGRNLLKTHPFAIVTVKERGGRGHMRVGAIRWRSRNPVFNQRFDFVCASVPESLTIQLYEKERFGADYPIGELIHAIDSSEHAPAAAAPCQWGELRPAAGAAAELQPCGEVQYQVTCATHVPAAQQDFMATLGLTSVRLDQLSGLDLQGTRAARLLGSQLARGDYKLRLVLVHGLRAFHSRPVPAPPLPAGPTGLRGVVLRAAGAGGPPPPQQQHQASSSGAAAASVSAAEHAHGPVVHVGQDCRMWVKDGEADFVVGVTLYAERVRKRGRHLIPTILGLATAAHAVAHAGQALSALRGMVEGGHGAAGVGVGAAGEDATTPGDEDPPAASSSGAGAPPAAAEGGKDWAGGKAGEPPSDPSVELIPLGRGYFPSGVLQDGNIHEFRLALYEVTGARDTEMTDAQQNLLLERLRTPPAAASGGNLATEEPLAFAGGAGTAAASRRILSLHPALPALSPSMLPVRVPGMEEDGSGFAKQLSTPHDGPGHVQRSDSGGGEEENGVLETPTENVRFRLEEGDMSATPGPEEGHEPTGELAPGEDGDVTDAITGAAHEVTAAPHPNGGGGEADDTPVPASLDAAPPRALPKIDPARANAAAGAPRSQHPAAMLPPSPSPITHEATMVGLDLSILDEDEDEAPLVPVGLGAAETPHHGALSRGDSASASRPHMLPPRVIAEPGSWQPHPAPSSAPASAASSAPSAEAPAPHRSHLAAFAQAGLSLLRVGPGVWRSVFSSGGANGNGGGAPAEGPAAPAAGSAPAAPAVAAPRVVAELRIRAVFQPKDRVEAWFFRRLLQEFDSNGDESLSAGEAAAMLEALGHKLNSTELDNLLLRFDTNKDGVLQAAELLSWLRSAEFHAMPLASSLLSFLAQGPAGLDSIVNDVTDVARGSPGTTTSSGAGVAVIVDAAGKEHADTLGLSCVDRATGLVVAEHIPKYVKIALRLMYASRIGSSAIRLSAIKSALKSMSAREGAIMNSPRSARNIPHFVRAFNINMEEVQLPPTGKWKNFNEFFSRSLKPEARPITEPANPRIAVSPADCRLNVYATMSSATQLWVKGEHFTVESLLGPACAAEAPLFVNGALAIARLAPQDYHRWHFPLGGRIVKRVDIDGSLFTVNPMAIRARSPDVYTDNKRVVTLLDTGADAFGLVAMVAVGATVVGSINILAKEGDVVAKGACHGFFCFGGSTVLLLFRPGSIAFDADLLHNSAAPLETLVRVGVRIGCAAAAAKPLEPVTPTVVTEGADV